MNKLIWVVSAIGVCVIPTICIYMYDLTYAWSMLAMFWIPVAWMLMLHGRWMNRTNLLLPFLTVNGILFVVACYFEFAAIGLNIWEFSETYHKLLRTIMKNPGLPYAIYGVPIEEFLFWCGATPFCVLLYLNFLRIFGYKEESEHEAVLSAWTLMMLPFVPLIVWLFKKTNRFKVVSGAAMAFTVVFFAVTMGFVESHAIARGHWRFHCNRVMPWYIANIPLDEVLYYIFGPIFVILLTHFFEMRPTVTMNGKSRTNDVQNLVNKTRNKIVTKIHGNSSRSDSISEGKGPTFE